MFYRVSYDIKGKLLCKKNCKMILSDCGMLNKCNILRAGYFRKDKFAQSHLKAKSAENRIINSQETSFLSGKL